MFFQNKEKLFFHCHLEWSYFSNHEKTHRRQKIGKPNQLLPKSDNVQKKEPLNQMRKIDGAEISRDKTVIGITEKAGQDLGRQNSNHCYPKTDMARKDQRQKEAGRTNDIVGFIAKQLVAAFFFFHIHTLS